MKTLPLAVILQVAEALSTAETAHAMFATAYRDLARKHAKRGNAADAARLEAVAAEHDYASLEARAEDRRRRPSPYIHKTEREQARSLAAYRGHETRAEREHGVLVNVPDELVPLWQKTKAMFKGTPHQRWERFMEYVEAHPGEAERALMESVGDDFAPPDSRAA
jgi:hypothetical protein